MALPGLVAAQNLSDIGDQRAAWNNLGREVNATILTTNLAKRSQELNLSPWQTFGATIVPNVAIAPDGSRTGEKLIPAGDSTGTTLDRSVEQQISKTANERLFVFSIFAKQAELTRLAFRIRSTGDLNILVAAAQFNLSNGTIGARSGDIFFSSIEPAGEGWSRLVLGAFLNIETNVRWRIVAAVGDEVGDGEKGIFLWGAQLQRGTILGSYIPTQENAITAQVNAKLQITADDILALRGVSRSSACDFVQIKGLTTLAQPRISAASINAQAATVFRDNALLKNSPVSEGDYYLSRGFLDGASLKVNNINLASISGSPFSGSTATSPLLFSSMGAPVNFRVSESMTLGTLSSPERAIPIETDDLILYAKAGQS
jgi:hypothetical protein